VLVLASAVLIAAGVLVRGHVNARQRESVGNVGKVSATPVRIARIERRVIPLQTEFHGFLAPFTELSVAAQVPGEIVEQWVEVSDDVTKDQPLFKIDEVVRAIEHEQALAVQERANSEFELAEANWRRIEALPEQTSISMERIEAEKKYRAAKADRHRAAAAVRQRAVLLERTTVKSPIDGVVSRIHLRRGEFTRQGQPLVDIVEIDRLKMLAEIEDRDVVWVTVGHPVVLTANTFPGETFDGQVHRIYPQALPTSRKFEVEIQMPNPDRRLRPGFFMRGTISMDMERQGETDPSGVLVVPREAVVELYGQQFCYVVSAGGKPPDTGATLQAQRTAVVVWPILSDPRSFQLVNGAAEGDYVVTKGLQHLSEQTTVRIMD
jgi:RND family efflux transporter MFP subunit